MRKGRLSVVSEDGSITFANLTDGAVFGELSVLNIQGNRALVYQPDDIRPFHHNWGVSLVGTACSNKKLFVRIMMFPKTWLLCMCHRCMSGRVCWPSTAERPAKTHFTNKIIQFSLVDMMQRALDSRLNVMGSIFYADLTDPFDGLAGRQLLQTAIIAGDKHKLTADFSLVKVTKRETEGVQTYDRSAIRICSV